MSTAESSVRDDLEAAMKASKAPAEVAEVEIVETPVVEASTEVESETQKQERARDATGRFVARDATSDDGAAKAGVGRVPEPADAELAAQPAAAAKPAEPAKDPEAPALGSALAPPNGWSAEAKAKWHELSPEVMAAVQKREQDVAKFTSTRDEHASFGKEVYQAVQPYLANIQAEGSTPATAIKSLLNTAYVLRHGTADQKRQAVQSIIQTYGVDLGVAPQPGARPQVAPELAPLYQEIDQLKAERVQAQQAEQHQLRDEVQREIVAFAADPKHQHYETVKGHMSALIGSGVAKDLQDAYDQAVWARTDTRATVLAQQRAEDEQKRRTEAKAKADAAKRKSIGITGGPGSTAAASAPEGRSLREELEANVAASTGAV